MNSPLSSPLICLFILLYALAVNAFELHSTTYEWASDQDEEYFTPYVPSAGERNTLLYLHMFRCIENSIEARFHSFNCILFLKKYSADGTIAKQTCYTRIDVGQLLVAGEDLEFRVAVIYKGKIVMAYYNASKSGSEGYRNYRAVDMSSCKFVDFRVYHSNVTLHYLLGSRIQPSVFLYDDGTVDVFEYDPNACDGARCRYAFDPRGELTVGPESYLPSEKHVFKDTRYHKIVRIFSVATSNASTSDYFASLCVKGKTQIVHQSGDGKVRELISLVGEQGDVFDVDYSRGYFGMCWVEESGGSKLDVYCKQFDTEAKKILNTNFTISSSVSKLRVFNLLEGGIVVLNSVKQRYYSYDRNYLDDENFHLRFVGSNGNVSDALIVSNLRCPDDKFYQDLRMRVSNTESYCLLIDCPMARIGVENKFLTTLENCIPKRFFSSL